MPDLSRSASMEKRWRGKEEPLHRLTWRGTCDVALTSAQEADSEHGRRYERKVVVV